MNSVFGLLYFMLAASQPLAHAILLQFKDGIGVIINGFDPLRKSAGFLKVERFTLVQVIYMNVLTQESATSNSITMNVGGIEKTG